MTICLDTNTLIQLFGRKARHYPIRAALLNGQLTLAISNEILFEYQEVVVRMLGPKTWEKLFRMLELIEQLHSNVIHTGPEFRFQIITADPDDNKFVDCAIAANADFIITDDLHFGALIKAGYQPAGVHRSISHTSPS